MALKLSAMKLFNYLENTAFIWFVWVHGIFSTALKMFSENEMYKNLLTHIIIAVINDNASARKKLKSNLREESSPYYRFLLVITFA